MRAKVRFFGLRYTNFLFFFFFCIFAQLFTIKQMTMTPHDTALLGFLSQFITDERKQRFEDVLDYRTRHLTVVLEDIFQPHNASAVLRSCDLRGIQDIHIVENNYQYDVNPDVVLGSTKWLDLYHYNEKEFNTPAAFEHLHDKGYKIVATCPHRDDFTPDTLPLDQPIALVFGTDNGHAEPSAASVNTSGNSRNCIQSFRKIDSIIDRLGPFSRSVASGAKFCSVANGTFFLLVGVRVDALSFASARLAIL